MMEIVVGTGGRGDSTILAKLIAYTPTGQIKSGFPWVVGKNTVGNPPTLFDLDNDGTLEILIRVKPDYNNINGIYAINHTGNLVPGFPFPITFGHSFASVAVGDMTGDNIPEIAYGGVEAVDSGKVWAYSLNGDLLPGYPARVYRTWVDGSVAIADVDGDGLGDVVCGTNGVSGKPGVIRAFNHMGQEVNGFPLIPPDNYITSFETHPTLVDIDRDGDTEIFAGRVDKFVYGWDTPGLYDSTKVWSTLKGNPARTGGMLRSPFAVSVKEQEEFPSDFVLNQNYPNPFNPSTIIKVSMPQQGDLTLRIFDVTGRLIRSFSYRHVPPGVHAVEWNGLTDAGLPASTGVYAYQAHTGDRILTRKMVLLK